ncbi:MAG: 50S ribosomal protein L10 [Deltaproteobacteria bacterium]|nr:50S ribosomal protein L10 [Deltaproteobacteria bacterium]
MNRTQKEQSVESLRQELGGVEALYLADYRGLTVEQVNELRSAFKAKGCSYAVVKNTLLKRAIEGTPLEEVSPLLEGPTAIAYSAEDPLVPAKLLAKFAKSFAPLEIKGAFFEGFRSGPDVVALSKMPGKDELRSTVLATMLAVPQGLLRLFLAAPQRLLLVLMARQRELEG